MKKFYETFTLPQYVKRWLGEPVALCRVRPGVYKFFGSRLTKKVSADTVADARSVIREMCLYAALKNDDKLANDNRVPANRERERAERLDDAKRAPGYYYVELPWGKTIVAYWGNNGSGGLHWWLAGHPHEHQTNYFNAIGDPVLIESETKS